MAQEFTPKVVTANALIDGDVIYLTAENTWSLEHNEAQLIEIEALANERLSFAAADLQIVGAYLADAVSGPDGPMPVHFREEFRAKGPSNYTHGKQETQQPRT